MFKQILRAKEGIVNNKNNDRQKSTTNKQTNKQSQMLSKVKSTNTNAMRIAFPFTSTINF